MAKLGKPAAAILIMAAIIAVLLTLCTPRSTSRSSALGAAWGRRTGDAVVRVLVLDFDPVIPDSASRPAHQAFGWSDPRELARQYAADVVAASGGRVRYDVVDWRTLDEFPPKRDGHRYTATSYAECLRRSATCHAPDDLDYERVLADQDVKTLVDRREVDEVWLFGGPYFGYFEAAMAGPGAFDINGGLFPNVPSTRPFAIMGFNSERGVAEMLHDLCHRTEATMARVYGGWSASELTTSWARFAANAHQANGRAGVGSCHYPPNATAEYDYANPRPVDSDAEDWLRYPARTGTRGQVSRESWGGPDYHRAYMRWWLGHLPRGDGVGPDRKLTNWWAYVTRFDSLVIAAGGASLASP
jgi:hypothetical protein